MTMICIENLSFSYRQVDVLSNLNFSVRAGEFWMIAGPNGSGKTTLLKLINKMLKGYSGRISIGKKDINDYSRAELSRQVAAVRQEYIPTFGFTVYETVLMARTLHFGPMGFESKTDREIVKKSLEMTNTYQFSNRLLSEISGGERQRVFIARALAQKSKILLLDEPTSSLDMKHQVAIYDLLKKLQIEQNITILMVVHDINVARQYCDQVLLLSRESQYITGTPGKVLNTDNIGRYYDVSGFHTETGDIKFFVPKGQYQP